jgi:hypothetical protein
MSRRTYPKSRLVFLVLCFVCTPVAAKSDPNAASKMHTIEIGPEISYFTYHESDMMKDTGMMYGVSGSYIYRGPFLLSSKATDTWMLRADGRYSAGRVDYDGHYQDGTPLTMNNIDDYIWEVRGLLGYDFSNKVARSTPYTGVGYRYLNDDSSSHSAGYERESNYVYIPIGVDILLLSQDPLTLSGIVEFDILASGRQKSHLGDFGYGTIKNPQHNGMGFRSSIRLQERKPGLNIGLEPFVRYWNIGNSAVVDGGQEPKNYSVEWGVRIVLVF